MTKTEDMDFLEHLLVKSITRRKYPDSDIHDYRRPPPDVSSDFMRVTYTFDSVVT